jgi:hypothetical protein
MPFFSIQSPTSGNATQLQGRAVAATGPTGGQVLTWDGSSWAPLAGTTGPTGAAGVDGRFIYSGSTGPSAGLGRSGDYFIDFNAGVLYGPKASNSWGSGLLLQSGQQGPTGPSGIVGATGATGPANGPTGATGATGADSVVAGPSGATGPTGIGATGPTGAQGPAGTTSYANLSGVPSNFPTNTTLVSGLNSSYSSINHAHNYVTSLNNLTGGLTLAAGSNVTLTANGSTLTLSSTGGITANDSIDGGDYIGQLVYGITFGTQPQSVNTSSTTTVSLASLSPSGNVPASVAQIPGGLSGARAGVAHPYSSVAFTVSTSTNNGATWTTASYESISSSGLSSPPLFSTTAATNGTRTVLGSYKLMRSDDPTANGPWTSTGYSWDNYNDGGYTVAFNGVRFVAVAKVTYSTQQPAGSRSLSVLSSSDGASWTARTLPLPVNTSVVITSSWKTVVAVNGVFVIGAVARQVSGGNMIYIPYIWTSSDGVSWTQSAFGSSATNADPSGIPTIDVFSDLASSGTVAVGVKGTTARYTTDGTTWGTSTLPVSCDRISYAAGYFWAFSSASGTDVLYSINGTSWTLGTMPVSTLWRDMAGGDSGFALSYGGGYASATIGASYGSANLTVSASATSGSAVSYQWQSSVDAGTTWANVANATSATLSLVNITSANNGTRYRAAASATGATTVFSQSATLTVN